MSLSAGTRFGPYEILAPIGAGGMGEVYKARDTRLNRLVAIKVLSPGRLADSDRKRRFLQEAQAASALNHPNIVTIHEIGVQDGIDFIVMEYVAGATLDHSIPRHGMRLAQLLDVAIQVADALATAHGAGIIHRDLKPGNIIVGESGRVKLLDFGLAKLNETPGGSNLGEEEETRTVKAVTEDGAILGTIAYMSPEQAEARPVDARSDIFSFGTVLYEMATGRRAFRGSSKLSTLSAILRETPTPVGELVHESPRDLEKIIARCLRKDPARRFQNAADVKVALAELKEESESGALETARSKPAKTRTRLWRHAVLVLVALAAAVWIWLQPGSKPSDPVRVLPLTTYPGSEFDPAFSPDGNQIAFAWDGENQDNFDIYVKLIGAGNPLRLTSDPASDRDPAWSPDGKWIAFSRAGKTGRSILVVPALGGAERRIAASGLGRDSRVRWSHDGRWLVARDPDSRGLAAFSFETGERQILTNPPNTFFDGGVDLSPDGKKLVFHRGSVNYSSALLTLKFNGLGRADGTPQVLIPPGLTNASPVWTANGKDVVFERGVDDNSVLYRVNAARADKPELLAFAGDGVGHPAISPRGSRMAFSRSLLDMNLWALDLSDTGEAVGEPKPVFVSSKTERCPRFSPDGKRIAFESNRNGAFEIWICETSGSGCHPITSFGGPKTGSPAWSPDGEWIVFDGAEPTAVGKSTIYVVNAGGGKPRTLTTGVAPRWSADGKRIYYSSTDPPGIFHISPSGGQPVLITKNGLVPEESRDGRFLYFSNSYAANRTYLRRIAIEGGKEEEVLPEIAGRNFVPVESGIWYLTPNINREGCRLEFFENATRRVRTVARIPKPSHAGLTLSPDRHRIVLTQVDQSGADLMLVENFR